jgi:hypothetical protein
MKLLYTYSIILLLSAHSSSFAAQPAWAARGTQALQGKTLTVVGVGQSPSLAIARQEAVDTCDKAAANHVRGAVKVRSITVETEKDASFHQEVSTEGSLTNLVMEPIAESIDEIGDSFRVWLQCRYQLERVRFLPCRDLASPVRRRVGFRTLTVSSIPMCGTILVRGKYPRTIACDSNPALVVVSSEDTEIVVRRNGYLPATLKLYGGSDVLEVTLDPR